MPTWADGNGVAWNAWGIHWAQSDWTTATAVAAIVGTPATINWKNITNPAALPSSVVTLDAKINERWRVEPSPIPSSVATADATINWRNYTATTSIAALMTAAANINWKNNTFATPVTGMVERAANINERWRVEPSALRSGLSTRDAAPGAYVFSPNGLKLTTFPVNPITTIDAFIRVGPWPDVDPRLYIDILAEDRVINIPAEDRSIQVEAEDRTITIRM